MSATRIPLWLSFESGDRVALEFRDVDSELIMVFGDWIGFDNELDLDERHWQMTLKLSIGAGEEEWLPARQVRESRLVRPCEKEE